MPGVVQHGRDLTPSTRVKCTAPRSARPGRGDSATRRGRWSSSGRNVLVLVHLLHGDVQVTLATQHSIPAVAPEHEQVFVYGSPVGGYGTPLLERFKAGSNAKVIASFPSHRRPPVAARHYGLSCCNHGRWSAATLAC